MELGGEAVSFDFDVDFFFREEMTSGNPNNSSFRRDALNVVPIFKMLILSALSNLSDDQIEYQGGDPV